MDDWIFDGVPWAPLGPPRAAPWAPLGCQTRFGNLVNAFVRSLSTQTAIWEFANAATGAAGATEVFSKTVAQTPPSTHAGGQGDGSYTNSLKPKG